MKKTYRASKSFQYGTRHLVAGDTFEAKPAIGQAYIAMKKATAVREPVKLSAPPLIVTDKIAKADRKKHQVDPTEQPAAVTQPQPAETDPDLAAARADYQEALGRRPYHGRTAAELRAMIAENAAEDDSDIDLNEVAGS